MGAPGAAGAAVPSATGADGSLEASLQQSQDMNLYYLQVQEAVNAQNRSFTLSGAVAGLAGGLYAHLLPVNAESFYLDLTFVTLAMLVIGGATSLWGAVVGAVAVSAVDSFLAEAENGVRVFGGTLDLPSGTRIVVVGALMALVLILRPAGLTGGRELPLPRAFVRGVLTKLSA